MPMAVRSVLATTGLMPSRAAESMTGLRGKQKTFSTPSCFSILAMALEPFMPVSPSQVWNNHIVDGPMLVPIEARCVSGSSSWIAGLSMQVLGCGGRGLRCAGITNLFGTGDFEVSDGVSQRCRLSSKTISEVSALVSRFGGRHQGVGLR